MPNLKLITTSLIISITLAACASTTPKKAPTISRDADSYTNANDTSSKTSSKEFVYAPNGREEFVFDEVTENLQKYAYKDICLREPTRSIPVDCSRHQLSYDKYVGKKGYFTDKPAFKDHLGYIAREAILETGEVIYAVSSSTYKHVGDTRISLQQFNKIDRFKPYPIVEGANVRVTGYSKVSRKKLSVSSQNKHSFSEKEIAAIKQVASHYPSSGGEIADLLSTLKIDYDDFENRTIVSGMPYNNKGKYISIKIVINEAGQVYPFLISHYEADNWLFVRNFSISADGYKWSSKEANYKRDHASGKVWEWYNERLTDEHIDVLERISKSNEAKIRYRGSKYYSDYTLTTEQKDEIKRLVEVTKLLTKT